MFSAINSRLIASNFFSVSCRTRQFFGSSGRIILGSGTRLMAVDKVPGTTPLRAHWRELQAALSSFWKLRSSQYLNQMQQRSKWCAVLKNLKVDDSVVIQEPTPPSSWRLGRVVEVRLGADGLVRVARVQVSSGAIYECSVRSLVPLLDEE